MAGKEDQQREETFKANPEHPSDGDVQTPLVSSRLCIKNLPKHYTERRFREHFSTIGEVTDCVIKNTHGGTDDNDSRSSWREHRKQQQQTSRCLGFIGYKTEQMAILAQKYFHNTFIDTSRIDVSFAASRKERAALSERSSWSKYSAGTSANERLKREEEKKLKKKNNKEDEDEDREEKKDPNRFIGVRERIKMEKAAKLKKEQFVSPEEKLLEEKMRDDPKLREYMALMLPKSKFAAKFWSDGVVHEEDEYLSSGGPPAQQTKLADIEDTEGGNADEDSDDDEYQDLENDAESSDDDNSSSSSEEIDSDSDDVKKDDAVSDMEYLKAKRGNFSSDSEDSEEGEEEENSSDDDDDDDEDNNDSEKSSDDEGKEFSLEKNDDDNTEKKKKSSKKSKDDDEKKVTTIKEVEVVQASDMESLQETGRVFLRNLPYTCTEEEIFDHMQSRVGKLTAVHVLVDKSTKQSKGLAYATFALPEDGVKCIDVLDGAIFQGRILHVLPAKRAPTNAEKNTLGGVGRITLVNDDNGEDNDDENDPNNNSYKKQKEHARKADAADKKAWNALFMRQDTVLSAVAAMYGVDKGDLLSTETEDVAVRVALGEAQVIANTKKELGDVGVNVHALESAAASRENVKIARSQHSILIKNLPYESEESDLREMCEKFGTLSQLVLPSTRTIAIAEFLESNEARRAFQGLAYKRYRHVPLYVEWAPRDIFKTSKKKNDDDDDDATENDERRTKFTKETSNKDDVEEDPEEKSKVLFVKNIDFATTDESFLQFFENLCKRAGGKNRRLVSAKIARKPNSDGKSLLSKGFGFVEFESHETASICSKLVSTGIGKLDGKVLSIELSRQKMSRETVEDDNTNALAMKKKSKIPKGKSATKLVLRNVAFEATKRDVQLLFNPFGVLKSVRVPKKFDGSHRGFAFIEYTTQREATDAMDALGNAHLYGRKCVIERADEDETVNTMDDSNTNAAVFGESNVEKLREKAKRQIDGGLNQRSSKRQQRA
jgi:multiple RNA-binding domain-containing protein 1